MHHLENNSSSRTTSSTVTVRAIPIEQEENQTQLGLYQCSIFASNSFVQNSHLAYMVRVLVLSVNRQRDLCKLIIHTANNIYILTFGLIDMRLSKADNPHILRPNSRVQGIRELY